ncbi:MAG: PEP-CTERM sorting domain-containing protein [Aquabacterium sp.]|nr:MAG: PEP-CTERM sorting domain-containing protein [Aquabacterium sp.]
MKFVNVLKSVAVATAVVAASAASAAPGDPVTFAGGTGTLAFGVTGVSGLATAGVAVAALPGATSVITTPSTNGGRPVVTQAVTGFTLAGGDTTPNVGDQIATLQLAGSGIKLVSVDEEGNVLGDVATLTDFYFQVSDKTLYGTVTIDGTSTTQGIYVGTTLTGSTLVPEVGSVTNTVTGLKLSSSFAQAVGAKLNLDQGVIDFVKTLNFGTLTSVATVAAAPAVPEPSTYALMGLGLAGATFVARRRAAK